MSSYLCEAVYRLLLPDRVLAALAHKPPVSPAGAGWHLWEVDLASTGLEEVQAVLRDLALELGECDARLDWVLVPPVAWGTSPRGVPYPCFLAAPPPVVAVGGADIDVDGAASLFLHGPSGHEVLPLPSGRRHLARLQGLVPGRYTVMVLHDRTGVPPERLAFEVVAEPPVGLRARWQVTAKDAVAAPQAGTVAVLPARDLAALDEASPDGEPHLRVEAPPGWPVRVSWKELAADVLLTTHADRDGMVDAHAVLASSHERRARRSMGDLVVDLAELGGAILRHERRPTPDAVRNRIDELVAGRGPTAQRLAGAYAELLPIWFEPICSALGYDVEPVAVDGTVEAPDHVSVCRLLHTERHGSTIERHPVRVLLLVEDLSKPLSDPLLAWLDDVCAAESLRDALVSDGLRWTGHRRTSRLTPRIWDLSTVSKDAEEFVGFLRVASEGV